MVLTDFNKYVLYMVISRRIYKLSYSNISASKRHSRDAIKILTSHVTCSDLILFIDT